MHQFLRAAVQLGPALEKPTVSEREAARMRRRIGLVFALVFGMRQAWRNGAGPSMPGSSSVPWTDRATRLQQPHVEELKEH